MGGFNSSVLNRLWSHKPLQRVQFDGAIDRIHAAIAGGDCYQINYTAALQAQVCAADQATESAQAQAWFARLQQAQQASARQLEQLQRSRERLVQQQQALQQQQHSLRQGFLRVTGDLVENRGGLPAERQQLAIGRPQARRDMAIAIEGVFDLGAV